MSELQLKSQCCGNCKHWLKKQDAYGVCNRNHLPVFIKGVSATGYSQAMVTLDLALCTQWKHVHTVEE